jgi:hypothetical protein
MGLPASTVVICEENKTRSDLYTLWLDTYEVQQALTEKQAVEAFGGDTAVLVIGHSFSDGGTDTVIEQCESQAPRCRILGIREQSGALPVSSYDAEMSRPVFEADLTECVRGLACRANYQLLIEHYYRTTVAMSSFEWQADDEPVEDDRYNRLRQRAKRLQNGLSELRTRMDDEDVRAVVRDITVDEITGVDSKESFDNKYRPDSCSRCGQDWSEPTDGDASATQLGAYVWRCVNCGHVQMHTDPSHRHIGSYR